MIFLWADQHPHKSHTHNLLNILKTIYLHKRDYFDSMCFNQFISKYLTPRKTVLYQYLNLNPTPPFFFFYNCQSQQSTVNSQGGSSQRYRGWIGSTQPGSLANTFGPSFVSPKPNGLKAQLISNTVAGLAKKQLMAQPE